MRLLYRLLDMAVGFVIIDVVLFDFSVSCPPLPPPVPAHRVPDMMAQDAMRDGLRADLQTILKADVAALEMWGKAQEAIE